MDIDLVPGPAPESGLSGTGHMLEELVLYGYRPFEDEPDPRPLPEARLAQGAILDSFDALAACLLDTRLEPDLEDLLWAFVNIFQRAAERVERELDDNEQAQRRLQREQDGSEIRSVELERALAEGMTLIERRDAMEYFRDMAADQFRAHIRKAWMPRRGSCATRRTLTSAIVDSRDFVNARRRADAQILVPAGTRVALSAGPDYNDVDAVFGALARLRAKYPDLVLLHGGNETGGERIAACWARDHAVPAIIFRPDWNKDRKAAPFRRNDRMLEALPKGLLLFPGSGIQDNLADKARRLGIPVWRCASG